MHLFPVKRTLFQYFFPDVFPVKSRHCFNIFSLNFNFFSRQIKKFYFQRFDQFFSQIHFSHSNQKFVYFQRFDEIFHHFQDLRKNEDIDICRLFRQLLHTRYPILFFTSSYPRFQYAFSKMRILPFHEIIHAFRFTWYTQWCNKHGYAPIKKHQYEIKSVRKIILFIP